jgi:O-acetyl-ADP-ribose deacetylase (regulator of RNase III)
MNAKIEIVRGDITEMTNEAIVNAANESLRHGGGVAGAISRKGGRAIQMESNEWVRTHGKVQTGSAAITSAGNLPSKYVIHAVGPVMGSGDEDTKLRSATISALNIALDHQIKSIAFPAISTGIYGYPIDRCARIMLSTVKDYLLEHDNLDRVTFCLFDQTGFDIFTQIWQDIQTQKK